MSRKKLKTDLKKRNMVKKQAAVTFDPAHTWPLITCTTECARASQVVNLHINKEELLSEHLKKLNFKLRHWGKTKPPQTGATLPLLKMKLRPLQLFIFHLLHEENLKKKCEKYFGTKTHTHYKYSGWLFWDVKRKRPDSFHLVPKQPRTSQSRNSVQFVPFGPP